MGDPAPPSPAGSTGPRAAVTVVASDEQGEVAVDTDRWAALATRVLADEGCAGELTLTFVDRDEIAALNAEHLGTQGPTDVLAFPLDALDALDACDGGAGGTAGAAPVLLGDVVICPAVAAEAAASHAGSLDDELALLTVHGVLHVLGHDHAEPAETAVMRARELELLAAHHWHGPAPTGFRQEQS